MALSEDETARHTAVVLLGALDDLPTLAIAMATAKHADVVTDGIVVLRHWIGRGPGQDMRLYQTLLDKAKFKPSEADVALQLLHSFSNADLKKPETYETLINFLESERPFIRALAHWHLVRLVHDGNAINFKPLGPKAERDSAVEEWRHLVPSGALPGAAKLKQ